MPAWSRKEFADSLSGHASRSPANKIHDRFRTCRTRPRHIERCISSQHGMRPVKEAVYGVPVPMEGTADRINDTSNLIEPFTKFPGKQQFSLWLLIECYESYPCHFWRQQGIKIDIAAHFRFESG